MDAEKKTCYEQIEELKDEVARLRESAITFGELAERLNQTLRATRRQRAEEAAEGTPRSSPHAP